jgi:hypothetical protein
MKYRVEFAIAQPGGFRWEFAADHPTRVEANEAAKQVRRRYGRETRVRIVPVADGAATPTAHAASAAPHSRA